MKKRLETTETNFIILNNFTKLYLTWADIVRNCRPQFQKYFRAQHFRVNKVSHFSKKAHDQYFEKKLKEKCLLRILSHRKNQMLMLARVIVSLDDFLSQLTMRFSQSLPLWDTSKLFLCLILQFNLYSKIQSKINEFKASKSSASLTNNWPITDQ